MWVGGFPYCRGGCGPWCDHGVHSPEDRWAIRLLDRGCCGHYGIMPAFEDCTPDLRRGLLAVCSFREEVVIGVMEAGGAEGGVAIRCGDLLPFFGVVWVDRVVLLRWASSKARGTFVGVGVGDVCQGLGPLD